MFEEKNPAGGKLTKLLLALAIGSVLATGAWAQDTDDDDVTDETSVVEEEDESADLDRIMVTGSRVRRQEFETISPLQVVEGEVARDLGLINAQDLLGQTTVVQGQQITTGISTSAGLLTDNGPGSATASLRGLDASRTLVLVNGRRLAPSGVRGAPSVPDLNMIPGSLIQRVDILLDGASSIYGSDAVAGVANFILRTDFDGLQLDAFYSESLTVDDDSDGLVSLTWGANSDRGFMGFAMEYTRQNGFPERSFSDFYRPYAGDCRSGIQQGASGELYEQCSGAFGAGAASTSAFGFLGFEEGRMEDGLPPGFFRIPVTADLLTPGSENGAALLLWPEELDAAFAPDFERFNVYTYGEYTPDWYGDATVYYEASHASRETDTNTSGQGRVRLPGDYPLANFGGLDGTLYYNSRFINLTEVDQTRLIAGIKGDLPGLDGVGTLFGWYYDAYASYSRSTGTDIVEGISYFPRLEQTLNNTFIDPVTGEAGCEPRGIPGEGQQITCRPLNFFDPTFILTGRFPDQADNDYLFPNRITNTEVEQIVYNGFVSGEVFDIPFGGPVSLVLGLEYREDKIRTDTDAGASAGDFFGFFGDPGSNGKRWLREFFTELDVPLIRGRKFADDLSLNFAYRWTEEENYGDDSTYRIQARWAPVEWLSFRTTYGTSFRAPNVGEQFAGQVTGFADPADPCRVPGVAVPFVPNPDDPDGEPIRLYNPDLDPRDPQVIDNCLNGGGPFGLPGTDPFSLGVRGLGTQNPVFFGAPTQVASGSNPNLGPETSDAFTAGVVFEQPWSDRFELFLSASYFDITIDGEIDQLTAATIVGRCYNSPGLTDQTCQFITRDPRVAGDDTSGEISFVEALQQNLGQQQVEGIDYNAEFSMDFSAINYGLIVRATQYLTQTEEEFRVDEIFLNDQLREYGNPEWRVNLTNVVTWGDFQFLWQARYISDMIEDNDDPEDEVTTFFSPCVQAGDTPCLQYDALDSYWVHDLTAAWRTDSMIVRVGMQNVFDEAPPLTDNNDLGSLGGIGYNIGGRTLFGNVTVQF